MNLKEQTYICTLARWGTISRAAEELHLTAPALSMFLSTLEKNLDVRLFRRTGKTLEPTAIGREYIRIAEKMLLLKEEFDQALAREKGRDRPLVRIGIQQRRAITAIPRLMSRLKQTLPELEVVFRDGTYSELSRLFEQRQVDYMFYTLEALVPGTEYTVLQREPVLAVIPRSNPCSDLARTAEGLDRPWLDPAALEGQTLILPPRFQSLRITIDRLLADTGVRPGEIMEIGNIAAIAEMAVQGMGIGFLRRAYLRNLRQLDNVCLCYLGQEPVASPLVLLYPPEKKKESYHAPLVDIFREISAGD